MTENNDWQKNGQYNSGEKVEKRNEAGNKSGLSDERLERYLKQHNENHKK
ncbi:hypothetical protein [Staphylococcus hominis]|nr:hypothetical protein [Staphylococcus hominis]